MARASLFVGRLSDRLGRKGILMLGLVFALPVLIILAPR